MLSSRWPRSPSPGKCSRRFCGSSRSYSRSHHQRQRETFDVMHSRATDRRGASKCQGKWPDQTLDQAFGLPEVLVAVTPRVCLARGPGKREHSCRFGIHLENLGFTGAPKSLRSSRRVQRPRAPPARLAIVGAAARIPRTAVIPTHVFEPETTYGLNVCCINCEWRPTGGHPPLP